MPCRTHMIREVKAIGNAVGDYELLRRRAHGAWLVIGLAMTVIVAGCGTEDGTRFDVEEGVVYNRGEGLWSESGAPPVTFQLVQVYGSEDGSAEGALARVMSVVTDTLDNVYVLDAGTHRIVSFREEGDVAWVAGQFGQGPGDLAYPTAMVLDGSSRLFVLNQLGRRLDVWSMDGFFERGVMVDALGVVDAFGGAVESLVGYVDPDTLVFRARAIGIIGINVFVATLNDELVLVDSFQIDQGAGREAGRLPVSAPIRMDRGAVISGHVEHYDLSTYSLSGRRKFSIRRQENHLLGLALSGYGPTETIRMHSGLDAPLRLKTGHLLTMAWWPTRVQTREDQLNVDRSEAGVVYRLDIFDESGRFLGSYHNQDNWLDIGWPVHVCHDGALYTFATSPWPQIRKYSVSISE